MGVIPPRPKSDLCRSWESRELDVRSGVVLRTGRIRFFYGQTIRTVARAQSYLSSQLLGFWQEVRSCRCRIWSRLRTPYQSVEIGPAYHQSAIGPHEVCTRRRASSQSIENFVASHPTATIIDVAHFHEGWEAGAQWRARNWCSCISGNTFPSRP